MKSKAPKGKTRARLPIRQGFILPSPGRVAHLIFDETPRWLLAFPVSKKTALLTKICSNHLVSGFLGFTARSSETNVHLSGKRTGQTVADEIYFGMDRKGRHFVVPVQAKGGSDKLSPVQAKQDIACCEEKFPGLICRAISAQFMAGDMIALFEFTLEDGAIKVVDEAHYRLVPSEQISPADLIAYRHRKT